ncbi:MAG: hypothetical protein GX088_05355 [Clostridia bacterium]|nr:hypothetical protein [Clostridia bacterium]
MEDLDINVSEISEEISGFNQEFENKVKNLVQMQIEREIQILRGKLEKISFENEQNKTNTNLAILENNIRNKVEKEIGVIKIKKC